MMRPEPSRYLEAHSALNTPFLASAVFAPAVIEIVCLILGLILDQPWFFVIMGWMSMPIMIASALLYRNWPTGVRIDESGITIGAVTAAQAARRRPTVTHQSRGLFTCPWLALQGARVVTDRDELRLLKTPSRYYTLTNRWGTKKGMGHVCNIGVLAAPLMRAALVIEVDPFAVTVSEVRPARYYSNFKDGYFSHLIQPQLSSTWIVPTRHPEALGAALRTALGSRRFASGQSESNELR
jgi:hypothetical protein